MAKPKKQQTSLKSLRARRDRRAAELQQCIQLIDGLEERVGRERVRRERLIGAISDLNEIIIEVDPKGPEAKRLAEARENQKPREEDRPEPQEPDEQESAREED